MMSQTITLRKPQTKFISDSLKILHRWPTYFLIAGLLLESALALAQDNQDWALEEKSNTAELWFRETTTADIPEFKIISEVDLSLAAVLSVILDIPACSKWVHRCKHAQSLEVINPHQQVIYQINKVPWVKDRDLIMDTSLSYRRDGRDVVIDIRLNNHFCKDNPSNFHCLQIQRKKYIPVAAAAGFYHLEQVSSTTTRITWQQLLDPGGKLSAWLVKPQLKKLALHTMKNLVSLAHDPKYQNNELHIENNFLTVQNKQVAPTHHAALE